MCLAIWINRILLIHWANRDVIQIHGGYTHAERQSNLRVLAKWLSNSWVKYMVYRQEANTARKVWYGRGCENNIVGCKHLGILRLRASTRDHSIFTPILDHTRSRPLKVIIASWKIPSCQVTARRCKTLSPFGYAVS